MSDDLHSAIAGRKRKGALQRALPVRETQLDEAGGGMARIAKHMNRPFAMISAFTKGTLKDNLEATKALAQDLIGLGIGGLRMNGNYGDPEISYFVPCPKEMEFEDFAEVMTSLGHRYDQHSVGISDGSDFSLHLMAGGVEHIGNAATMNPKAVADYWSEIKGKRFVIVPKDTIEVDGEEKPNHIDHTRLKS